MIDLNDLRGALQQIITRPAAEQQVDASQFDYRSYIGLFTQFFNGLDAVKKQHP